MTYSHPIGAPFTKVKDKKNRKKMLKKMPSRAKGSIKKINSTREGSNYNQFY